MLSKYGISVDKPEWRHHPHSLPTTQKPHHPLAPQDKQIIDDDVRLMFFGEWKSRWQVAAVHPATRFRGKSHTFPALIPYPSSKCFHFAVETNGNLSALISACLCGATLIEIVIYQKR